jgi:dihydrofolate synthase/folylpolyglutamate synthase
MSRGYNPGMDENLRYKTALDYLLSFVDFSLTHQEQIAPERFELERMALFLEKLGNPHHAYPSIHIAGTKGKGSVAAHCAAALQAGGYKTGLYTSPHLHDFRERIQIDGEMIPENVFSDLVDSLKPAIEAVPGMTSYELQTALAMVYFSERKAEAAVFEVGMGGRLDSTNVITPLVSVITPISYDHTRILGDTLTEIAGEKGGIIKPGIPVVSSPQQPEVLTVLEKIALEKGSGFTLVGREIRYATGEHNLSGQRFKISLDGGPLEFETRLLGQHQVENAVTAYTALREASREGLDLDEADINEGFRQVRWPGRFEVVSRNPAVVFDGAHNRESARRLVETMREYFPGEKYVLVFGAMEDKDIPGMFAELLPDCAYLLLTSAEHPRAAQPDLLQELAAKFTCPSSIVIDQHWVLPEALGLAGDTGVVLITGSLSIVGDFRSLWFQKNSQNEYN